MDEQHTPETAINFVLYLIYLIFPLYIYFMDYNFMYLFMLFALFAFYLFMFNKFLCSFVNLYCFVLFVCIRIVHFNLTFSD